MIDFNKYGNKKIKHISTHRSIRKGTTKKNNNNNITKENKQFLKLIGLLK